MALPTTITDLSITAASNSPQGSDTVTPSIGPDEFLRALSAIIKREQSQAADVASGATVNLGAIADGSYVKITGTTTITAFGTIAAGIERALVFTGILTLTHNATSLILPGGANIITAAGDAAVFISEGSGNWRCIGYRTASGAAIVSDPLKANIASPTFTGLVNFAAAASINSSVGAGTFNLAAATGNTLIITGTTTITAFTMNAGQQMEVLAGGIFQLTYHATTMKLNSAGADYPTAVGDRLFVNKDVAGTINVTVVRQDGKAMAVVAVAAVAGTLSAGSSASVTCSAVFSGSGLVAHGLGVKPQIVTVVLECITAQEDYVTGDQIEIGSSIIYNISGQWSVFKDATYIGISVGDGLTLTLIRKNYANRFTATNASWKFVATPYKIGV